MGPVKGEERVMGTEKTAENADAQSATDTGLAVGRVGSRVEVGLGGRTILRHEPTAPCLVTGSGEGKYHAVRGHFTVHDSNLHRRDVGACTVEEESPNRVRLSFENTGSLLLTAEGRTVTATVDQVPEGTNRVWLGLMTGGASGIYGCGEQYTFLNLQGRKVPLWVQEQGVGRAHDLITVLANLRAGAGGHWYNTYFPQPSFVTSTNMAVVCHTAAYAEFNFRKRDRAVLHFWEVPNAIKIHVDEATPGSAVGFVSEELGRAPALPEWIHDGMILGVQGGTDAVAKKYKDARDAGVAVSALWAQDWEGKRETSFGRQLMWDWKYDAELYPNLPETIAAYKKEGVRVLGYINPYLALEGDLYAEATKKGYCVKRTSGEDYYVPITTFSVAIVDLTNPDAYEWLKGVIKENMIGIGLDGWMADFGEYLPTDCVLHSGESPALAHNRWPTLWAKVNYEAVEEAGKLGEILYFMRAGYTGSSRYATAYWAGDQLANWSFSDGLATVIPASISIGMSGVGYFHSDLGGYTSLGWVRRGKRLFARWTELATFAPIMRSHEGNRPDTNWQFNTDTDTLRHLARMTALFKGLKPYHRHLVQEYSRSGLPAIRHPFVHYPTDRRAYRMKYQFLYGADLMVAPVRRPFRHAISVYLPDDEWVHLWSGKVYRGGWHRIAAPVGRPAVFYRKGSDFADLFAELPTAIREKSE
jgi:alpha-glucosidase